MDRSTQKRTVNLMGEVRDPSLFRWRRIVVGERRRWCAVIDERSGDSPDAGILERSSGRFPGGDFGAKKRVTSDGDCRRVRAPMGHALDEAVDRLTASVMVVRVTVTRRKLFRRPVGGGAAAAPRRRFRV
ncbi:hypothetical protein Salat_0521700 [Sesamum alatum]|uniref:Uncharacterized protein n=1 Tax=Sesamum alatum TaxID=300844 RepID=A0AAE1YNA6_9LAMI|nr:hypothetical protein Salat_0521700 [Sesamum alatum]